MRFKACARLVLVALFLQLPLWTWAKWDNAFESETWGLYQHLGQDALAGLPVNQYAGLEKMEARFRYRRGGFSFAIDPQIRLLTYNSDQFLNVRQARLYSPTIRAPERGMRLETGLSASNDYGDGTESQGSLERLTVGWKNKTIELNAGRQAFTLGVLKVVPVWNRFSQNMPLPGTLLQFPTRDGFAFRAQAGDIWNMQAFSIFGTTAEQNVYLTEQVLIINDFEFRGLFGEWEKNLSAGAATSIPFLGGTLRGEFLNTGYRSTDPIQMYQFGVGFETALNASWSFTVEDLYLSSGETNIYKYDVTQLNSFRPLLAKNYLVLQVKYDPGQFYSFEPQTMINTFDGSAIVGADFTYSLGDHSELIFVARIPTGGIGQEFSSAAATPENPLGPTGTPQQYIAKLRLFF